MFDLTSKRGAAKLAAAIVVNSMTCSATEKIITDVTDCEEDNTTVHYMSLGIGTMTYYSFLHRHVENAVDSIADWRIARKEKKAAATPA
jgi:hypothetical protein